LTALQKAAMYYTLSTHKPLRTMKILSIRRIQQQKENEESNKVSSMLGFFSSKTLGSTWCLISIRTLPPTTFVPKLQHLGEQFGGKTPCFYFNLHLIQRSLGIKNKLVSRNTSLTFFYKLGHWARSSKTVYMFFFGFQIQRKKRMVFPKTI
jgi:hypothetical protein